MSDFLDLDLDLNLDLGLDLFDDETSKKSEDEKKEKVINKVRASCIERQNKHMYRRAFSETQLLDIVDLNFKKGDSYHF